MPESTPTLHFEEVESNLGQYVKRAKVAGGWIVVLIADVRTVFDHGGVDYGHEYRASLTFVPDPRHEWSLEARRHRETFDRAAGEHDLKETE